MKHLIVGFSALVVTIAGFSCLPTGASMATKDTNFTARHAQVSGGQLADEVTRRLRRMGFDGIHVRTARPPEMIGQLC